LSEIQINHYWSNGYNRYKVDIQDLKKIADKNNWINETDEFEVVPEVFIEEDETNELKNQIKSLKQQILDLQSQIEEKNLELEILK
jgi:hypothetical protein